MIPAWIVEPEEAGLENWWASDIVNAGPLPIYSGQYAGKFAITRDFLSPDVVAGSPDNEKLRERIESLPQADVTDDDLTNPSMNFLRSK